MFNEDGTFKISFDELEELQEVFQEVETELLAEFHPEQEEIHLLGNVDVNVLDNPEISCPFCGVHQMTNLAMLSVTSETARLTACEGCVAVMIGIIRKWITGNLYQEIHATPWQTDKGRGLTFTSVFFYFSVTMDTTALYDLRYKFYRLEF